MIAQFLVLFSGIIVKTLSEKDVRYLQIKKWPGVKQDKTEGSLHTKQSRWESKKAAIWVVLNSSKVNKEFPRIFTIWYLKVF